MTLAEVGWLPRRWSKLKVQVTGCWGGSCHPGYHQPRGEVHHPWVHHAYLCEKKKTLLHYHPSTSKAHQGFVSFLLLQYIQQNTSDFMPTSKAHSLNIPSESSNCMTLSPGTVLLYSCTNSTAPCTSRT